LDETGELLHAARRAHMRARMLAGAALKHTLRTANEPALNPASTAPSMPIEQPCEHRRKHRFGPSPKITRDPAMQAFLRARADTMTFAAIAEEIVKHFPKDRHVSRSTVQRWWKKHR